MSITLNSYAQCANALKREVHQVLSKHRKVYIHCTKLAALCNDLMNFHRTLMKTPFSTDNAPKEVIDQYIELISLATSMLNLFEKLSEDNFIEYLRQNSITSVSDEISIFKKRFNALSLDLNLTDTMPFEINEAQDLCDAKTDCIAMQYKLEPYGSSPEIQKRVSELTALIKQLEQRQNELIGDTESNVHELTAQEIADGLREFSSCFFKHSDFELQRKTGFGTYSEVFCGYQKSTGKVVAIKKITENNFNTVTFAAFKREVSILHHIKHFALLPFVGITPIAPFYIITEFMSGGSLYNRLHNSRAPMEPTKLTIAALGIAYGMSYLHQEKIIHRDLKSLNVLLDADDFPHICDYGTSTFMNEGSTTQTKHVGTPQWMAPEVLSDSAYNLKADVYSYGIVLWELVTKDVPFRGLKDPQVAQAVIEHDKRPLIPQGCPQKLGKLIRQCWDRDPDRRPTFAAIAQQFESGEVIFPGTDMEQVEAYCTQFSLLPEAQLSSIDTSTPSQSRLSALLDSLLSDDKEVSLKAATLAASLVGDPTWQKLLTTEGSLKVISRALNESPVVAVAGELMKLCEKIARLPEIAPTLASLSPRLTDSIMQAFSRFGNTSMAAFVGAVSQLMEAEESKPVFTGDILSKLAMFVQSGDLKVRMSAFRLVQRIVCEKLYDSDASIAVIIPNVIANAMPGASEELLELTISLLSSFTEIPGMVLQMNKADAPSVLISLCLEDSIADKAIDLVVRLVEGTQPNPRFVSLFVECFKELIERFDDLRMSKPLLILASVMRTPLAFKEFSDHPESAYAMEKPLSSKHNHIVLMALKLTFVLLSNDISSAAFVGLRDPLIQLLSREAPISSLAASCLTHVAASGGGNRIDCEEVGLFIMSNLEGSSSLYALRLCGVIARDFKGGLFLDKCGAVSRVSEIATGEGELKWIAVAVLAALSSSISYRDSMEPAVAELAGLLNSEYQTKVIASFISNIAASPKGARSLVPFFKNIVNAAKQEDSQIAPLCLSALERITSADEAVELLTVADAAEAMKLIELVSGPTARIVLTIYCGLMDIKGAPAVFANSQLGEVIAQMLPRVPTSHPFRKVLSRIKSFL